MPDISNLPIYQTSEVGSTTSAGEETSNLPTIEDVIEDSKKMAIAPILLANQPILITPSEDIDLSQVAGEFEGGIAQLAMSVEEHLHEMKTDILDEWMKAIELHIERTDDYYNSPDYLAKLKALSPEGQQQEMMRRDLDQRMRTGLSEGVRQYNKSEQSVSSGDVAFLAAGLIAGVAMVGSMAANMAQSVTAVPQGMESTYGVFQDAWVHFEGIVDPSAIGVNLAYAGAFFSSGAINFAAASNLLKAASGKPQNDITMVKEYAAKVINLSAGKTLDYFVLGSIVDKLPGAEKISEERKLQLASIVKVVLLSTALAAVYMSQTKWITEEEFKALVTGTMKPSNPQEEALVVGMQATLNGLPEDERAAILNAAAGYIGSNPNLSDMFDIGKAFKGIRERLPHQDQPA